jgi:hypothetical protein
MHKSWWHDLVTVENVSAREAREEFDKQVKKAGIESDLVQLARRYEDCRDALDVYNRRGRGEYVAWGLAVGSGLAAAVVAGVTRNAAVLWSFYLNHGPSVDPLHTAGESSKEQRRQERSS